MNQGLRYTFLVHAVVCLIFGLGFLLVPAMVAGLYQMSAYDPFTSRALGAGLLGLAVSSWFSYRAARWDEVRIVVQMEIAYTLLGVLGVLYSVVTGTAPALGWLNLVIFLVFAALWIYFYTTAVARAAAKQSV